MFDTRRRFFYQRAQALKEISDKGRPGY